jgi:hypothetical protein
MGDDDSGVKFLIGSSAGKSAVIAAFIATHVATMAGLWFGGARLPTFNFNQLNGLLAFQALGQPLSYGFTHPVETFLIGGLLHYTSGIIWGVAFALIVHPALGRFIKPFAALTPVNNYIKGVIWGVVLWIISSAFWMPLLIDPLFGGGVVGPFLTKFGLNGVQALLTNLLWHSIYGVNLGLLFSPTPAAPSRSAWKASSGVGVR